MLLHSLSSASITPGTPSVPASHRVLVALRNVHEEIVAGTERARLVVRTLDELSCDVCAGELLIVTGGVASGARSLMHALNGSRPLARGERIVARGVRLRLAAIAAQADHAIVEGWLDRSAPVAPLSASTLDRSPVVYLLRARHRTAGSGATFPRSAWRRWSSSLRAQGDAVVILREELTTDLARNSSARGDMWDVEFGARASTQAHRIAPTKHVRSVIREAVPAPASVRTLTLHAGRIVSVVPASYRA